MTFVKLEDAVKVVEALQPASLKPKGVGLVANITIAKAVAALRSLPTDDGVTDDMVERVAMAICEASGEYWYAEHFGQTLSGNTPEEMRDGHRDIARAALKAALGPLPAPPSD